MDDTPPKPVKQQPHLKDRAQADLQARRAREAAALRANLHRRKAQIRSRADQEPPPKPDPDAETSA